MSGDELLAFLVSLVLAGIIWVAWFADHIRVASALPAMRKRQRRGLAFVVPMACAAILFVVLRQASSFDVRDSTLYLSFYMVMGAAWTGIGARAMTLAGISPRDDVIERHNGAAAMAVTGALIGITLAFAGGNVGDGPGWYVVVYSAGLATVALFALWMVLDAFTGITDAITVERDDATGLRLAGFLIAQGMLLGRSVSGDWASAIATARDLVLTAWPAIPLLGLAILVERSFRVRPDHGPRSAVLYGLLPAIAYVIAAVAYVARLAVPR